MRITTKPINVWAGKQNYFLDEAMKSAWLWEQKSEVNYSGRLFHIQQHSSQLIMGVYRCFNQLKLAIMGTDVSSHITQPQKLILLEIGK